MDQTFSYLGALTTIIGAVAIGLPLIAFGQVMNVLREIALNTRKEGVTYRTEYNGLQTMGTFVSLGGWFILVIGSIFGILGLFI